MQPIVSSGKFIELFSFQGMSIDESFVLTIINKRSLLEDGLLENKEPLGSSRRLENLIVILQCTTISIEI